MMEQETTPKLSSVLLNGIVFENPVFVQLLGMCPTLATSSSVKNALGMGLSATAVLICSNLAISALRKLIPDKVRIAAYIIVIAGFVTAVDLLLQAFFPELSKSLGVFIPLIVVNCIILARAEAFASKNRVLPSAVDGLGMGLGFTLALLLLGSIREILVWHPALRRLLLAHAHHGHHHGRLSGARLPDCRRAGSVGASEKGGKGP